MKAKVRTFRLKSKKKYLRRATPSRTHPHDITPRGRVIVSQAHPTQDVPGWQIVTFLRLQQFRNNIVTSLKYYLSIF